MPGLSPEVDAMYVEAMWRVHGLNRDYESIAAEAKYDLVMEIMTGSPPRRVLFDDLEGVRHAVEWDEDRGLPYYERRWPGVVRAREEMLWHSAPQINP